MIELKFQADLYDGFAIDEAAKVYAPFAGIELVREPDLFVVRLTATADDSGKRIDERTLGAELANYALGLTVEKQLDSDAASAAPAGMTP